MEPCLEFPKRMYAYYYDTPEDENDFWLMQLSGKSRIALHLNYRKGRERLSRFDNRRFFALQQQNIAAQRIDVNHAPV